MDQKKQIIACLAKINDRVQTKYRAFITDLDDCYLELPVRVKVIYNPGRTCELVVKLQGDPVFRGDDRACRITVATETGGRAIECKIKAFFDNPGKIEITAGNAYFGDPAKRELIAGFACNWPAIEKALDKRIADIQALRDAGIAEMLDEAMNYIENAEREEREADTKTA